MKLLNQKKLNELLVVGNSPEYGTMNKHGGSEGAETRRTYIKRITRVLFYLLQDCCVNATHETFYQIINDISSGNCQGCSQVLGLVLVRNTMVSCLWVDPF